MKLTLRNISAIVFAVFTSISLLSQFKFLLTIVTAVAVLLFFCFHFDLKAILRPGFNFKLILNSLLFRHIASFKTRVILRIVCVVLFASCFRSPNVIFSIKAFLSIIFYIYLLSIVINTNLGAKCDRNLCKFFLLLCFALYFLIAIVLLILQIVKVSTVQIPGLTLSQMPIVYFAFIPLFMKLEAPKKVKYLFLTVLYLCVFCIISHYHSATAKVAVILGLCAFGISRIFNRKLIYMLSVASFFSLYIFVPLVIENINLNKVFDKVKIELSFKHRLCIMKYSLDKFKENPIFGKGLKSSRFFNNDKNVCFVITRSQWAETMDKHGYNSAEMADDFVSQDILYGAGYHPHNFVVQTLFEMGIIGGMIALLCVSVFAFFQFKPNVINIGKNAYLNTEEGVFLAIFVNFTIMYLFSYSMWESRLLNFIVIYAVLQKMIQFIITDNNYEGEKN